MQSAAPGQRGYTKLPPKSRTEKWRHQESTAFCIRATGWRILIEVRVGHDLTHIAFEVDDLETLGRHAAALGYPFSDGPTATGTGSLIAFLDAPEGYEIELIQRTNPEANP